MVQRLGIRDVTFPEQPPAARRRRLPRISVETDDPATTLPRTRREVLAGFRNQTVQFELNGQTVAVRRGPAEAGRYPFEQDSLLISVPVDKHGEPVEPPEGVVGLPAVAVAADHDWVDHLWIVPDTSRTRSWAHRLGGRSAVQWQRSGQAVIDLAAGQVVERFPVAVHAISHRCCPMIPNARPGDTCRPVGGPWIGRSIRARALWNIRRWEYVDALGCDEDCAVTVPRGPYGSTRYRRIVGVVDLAQPERHVRVGDRCELCHLVGHAPCVGSIRPHPIPGVVMVTDRSGVRWTLPPENPIVLRKGQAVEIGLQPLATVMDRITIDPAGGDEDLLDWDNPDPAWIITDADIAARFGRRRMVTRWAAVGDIRITGKRVGKRLVPVAFDLRQPDVLTSGGGR